jgi:esterase/lipase superfamily enzyme
MEIQYFKHYSHALGREMECKVYGHKGKPVLFIPCQDGRFVDFENFKMIDEWAKWIEEGHAMVFSIDTVDKETWSDQYGFPKSRIERHERWVHYIVDEFVPFMRNMANERNGWTGYPGIMVFGASMGANHSVNLFLRFPEIFDRMLAMSGIYNNSMFFGDYMDEVLYMNSPALYLQNMQPSHPYVERYNNNKGIICTGQGAWEEPDTLRWLDTNFRRLGADIWCDYWGYDVNHDWPWWYKQVQYFVPKLLGLE